MAINAVLIDSREPDWVKGLSFGGVPAAVQILPHGDLTVCCDDGSILLIERKTPDDFLGSLRDERLFEQLSLMKERGNTPWCYVMVTGEFQRGQNDKVITERGLTGWDWKSVQGTLLSIQEMGVFVAFASGDHDYEAAIIRLANRKRTREMLLEPARVSRVLNTEEAILASLPGIGAEKAPRLIEHCKSAAWALVGLTEPAYQLPGLGIGPGTKANIRRALGLKADEEFTIIAPTTEEIHE